MPLYANVEILNMIIDIIPWVIGFYMVLGLFASDGPREDKD